MRKREKHVMSGALSLQTTKWTPLKLYLSINSSSSATFSLALNTYRQIVLVPSSANWATLYNTV